MLVAWMSAVAGVLVVAAGISFLPPVEKRGARLRLFVLVAVCVGLFVTMLLPSLGTRPGGRKALTSTTPGVVELRAVRAGSYDVSVLRAETPGALSDWLAARDLRRPDERAQKILRDYIARKWCFAVAALRVEKGRPSAPHPLSVTFPVGAPLYPMRLTQLAGSTVNLELYVIAAERAAHPLMDLEFADRLSVGPARGLPRRKTSQGEISDGVGLPELCELMWDDCVLSKLAGPIAPEQMNVDLTVTLKEGPNRRKKLYTVRGALEGSGLIALAGVIAGVLLVLLYHVGYRRPRAALRIGSAAAGVFLLASGVTYALLPKIDLASTQMGVGGLPDYFWDRSLHTWARMFAEGVGGLGASFEPAADDETVARKFIEWLPDYFPASEGNRYLGGRIRREKSPGNFWIQTIDGKRYLITYGVNGRPYYAELLAATDLQ